MVGALTMTESSLVLSTLMVADARHVLLNEVVVVCAAACPPPIAASRPPGQRRSGARHSAGASRCALVLLSEYSNRAKSELKLDARTVPVKSSTCISFFGQIPTKNHELPIVPLTTNHRFAKSDAPCACGAQGASHHRRIRNRTAATTIRANRSHRPRCRRSQPMQSTWNP